MKLSKHSAFRIAGIYGLAGVLWIAVSDRVVSGIVQDTEALTLIQNYKGFGFILITSVLVYFLTFRALAAQTRLLRKIEGSEARFRALYDGSSDAVFLHDGMTGLTVDVNARASELFGHSREAMCQLPISALSEGVAPYDEEAAQRWLNMAMAGKMPSFEWHSRHANGQLFWTGNTMRRVELAGRPHVLVSVRDITAQKDAERALRESEEKFSRAFHGGVMAMAILSEVECVVDVNDAMVRLVDCPREALIGKRLDEIGVLVEDIAQPRFRKSLRETLLRAGVVRDAEIQVRTRTGGRRFVLLFASVLSLGRRPHAICALTDVTERRQFENALRESEKRFRTAVVESPFPALIHAEDGEILTISHSWTELTGYTRDDLKSLADWVDLAYGVRAPMILPGIQELYGMEGSREEGEFRIRCRDGSERVWEMTSTALGRLPDGRRAVISMGVDITERKRNDAAMRDSEERYRLLFASNPNPMWVYDLNTLMFLEVNEAAISKYGYSREEFLGMTIAEIRPPEEVPRMLAAIAAVQDTSNSPGVWRHRCKDGTLIDAEVNTHGVNFEGRAARLVLANDITERLRAEEGREAAEVALRQAQKMEVVGRLAGGVAHDFNNMLSVILGYTDQAIQILPRDHELQPSLEQIMIAAKRSADLTRQLLTFSRKQVILPRVVDLNQVLADHQKMLGRLIGEHIDLRFAPGEGLWPVRIDPVQVNQVLANLAVNARDAIGEVGALRVATLNVTLAPEDLTEAADAEPGDYVLIVVADSGTGMDAATMELIFEPFFTTKEEGKGTGLGLATVYGIVKQNNGFLRVESTPGMGTTFYLYLPRYGGDVDPQEVAPASVATRGVETILIVEDEALILTLTQKALTRQGYHVLCAASPSEACRICEEHPGQIDLVLSDLIMPEMNGRELSNRIQAMRPAIRTIFMSGYTADLIASQGILEEGVDFLQKPFPVETLAAKVREVLDRP